MTNYIYKPEYINFGSCVDCWNTFYKRPKAQEFINSWRSLDSLKVYLKKNPNCAYFIHEAFYLVFDNFNKTVYNLIAKNCFSTEESLELFIKTFFTQCDMSKDFKKTNYRKEQLHPYKVGKLINLVEKYFLEVDSNWDKQEDTFEFEHNYEFILQEDILKIDSNWNKNSTIISYSSCELYMPKGTVLEIDIEEASDISYEDKLGNSAGIEPKVLRLTQLNKGFNIED